ncbi:MAG: (2Fe-2S)-binding protein [Geminicoccaceae bacterium]|nr:(2Fe-2S)-binding protein [Geminicoccaceae bacterium]MCS7267089.1 (2Fe-2S)-binding protein [Geminicoccaceae bacterium]MCX7630495.1 (2Fe-2S)-binding protein [Geminicoccaceae bacterium]MDW8124959.1 (2Fe-2S)-binding protein [Geminicoccaceae bacterium]MDW8342259.1 (2Fe-2S)-binding protein [Geminicoccaceae bacterium]
MAIGFRLNGREVRVDAPGDMPILWALRDILNLTGTKYGCGIGACGACTIHLDGKAVLACVVRLQEVAGREVTTIEGLDPDGNHPVQRAWAQLGVPQCGYCQTGQIMRAAALLAEKKNPTDAEIDEAMAVNICRCGCYQRIHAAVRLAATGV